jgi:hypothetical protein
VEVFSKNQRKREVTTSEKPIIRKIPTEFKTYTRGIKREALILERPIREIPISSGKGDATIMAPIKGSTHEKILMGSTRIICFPPSLFHISRISESKSSLTNLNRSKSLVRAPALATAVIKKILYEGASTISVNTPAEKVKVETYIIPPKKAPKSPSNCKVSVSFGRSGESENNTIEIKKMYATRRCL